MATIKQNFFYNTLLNVSRVLFPLITAPYVSRVLAPEGVGLFNFSLMYASYFAMVAALGIPTYGVREIAKVRSSREETTKLTSELMSISIIMTLAVSAVYLLSIAFIPKLSKDIAVFLVMGIMLYLTPFNIDWFFSGLEQFKYISLRSIFIKTISVVAMFLFVKTRSDLLIYVIINVFAGVANNIWNFVKMLCSGVRPRFVLKGLKRHWSPILILFASAVAISVYTVLDTLMLGFMKEYSEVAYYTNASNISRMIMAAITSFSAVAVPRLSFLHKEGDKEKINELVTKSFSVVAFLAFPAAMGLCCIAPTFVPLFYGDQFYGTILPLQILSFLLVVIGFNNLSGTQVLVSLGKDKFLLYSVIAGALFNFLSNLLLIPAFGARGASIASIGAEAVVLGVSLYYVYKATFVRISGGSTIVKAFLGTLLFIPLLILLKTVVDGWWLVGVFCLSGFILYILIELLIKNPALDFFFDVVRKFVSKHFGK